MEDCCGRVRVGMGTRETRHLRVAGVPESITTSDLQNHFSKFGRVAALERLEGGADVRVSFADLRSATKAAAEEHRVEGAVLRALYLPPDAVAAPPPVRICTDAPPASSSEPQRPPSPLGSRRRGKGGSWRTRRTEDERGSRGRTVNGGGSGREAGGGREGRGSGGSSASPSPSHSSRRSSLSPAASQSSRGSKPPRDKTRDDSDSPLHPDDPSTSSRNNAFLIRNFSSRSTDSSIKEGLYHTCKKHVKVVSVKVVGEGEDRYAIVNFTKKGVDVRKALSEVNKEMFFGSRLGAELAPSSLVEADDNEKRPLDRSLDELHPRSSRTLYVGNLDARTTNDALRDKFKTHGNILDIDIKNRDTPAPYSFIQYADIASCVRAIHASETANLGGTGLDADLPSARHKVGFGKTLQSAVVWLGGLADAMEQPYLFRKMKIYGDVKDCLIDNNLHQALITFSSLESAVEAVKSLKSRSRQIASVYVQVDYGSAPLTDLFIDRIYRAGKKGSGKDELSLLPPELGALPVAGVGETGTGSLPRREHRSPHRHSSSSRRSAAGKDRTHSARPNHRSPDRSSAPHHNSSSRRPPSPNRRSDSAHRRRSRHSHSHRSSHSHRHPSSRHRPSPKSQARRDESKDSPHSTAKDRRHKSRRSRSSSHSTSSSGASSSSRSSTPSDLDNDKTKAPNGKSPEAVTKALLPPGNENALHVPQVKGKSKPSTRLGDVFDLAWQAEGKRKLERQSSLSSGGWDSEGAARVPPPPVPPPSSLKVEDSDSSTGLASATSPLIPAPPPAPDIKEEPAQIKEEPRHIKEEPPTPVTPTPSTPANSSESMVDLLNSAVSVRSSEKEHRHPSRPPHSAKAKAPSSSHSKSSGSQKWVVPMIPLESTGSVWDPRTGGGETAAVVELPAAPFAATCFTPSSVKKEKEVVTRSGSAAGGSSSSEAGMMSPDASTTVAPTTPASASPSRPSLEDRIRALDAKFSALEHNMAAVKPNARPVDITKYVKKRPASFSSKEVKTSPESTSALSRLYKSDIFDQDLERLKSREVDLAKPSTSKASTVDILSQVLGPDPNAGQERKKPFTPGGIGQRRSTISNTSEPKPKESLSITIPPPPAAPSCDSGRSGGGSASLVSPPPLHGILKKNKTPPAAITSPTTPSYSAPPLAPPPPPIPGPIYPPNFSIPPPVAPFNPAIPPPPVDPRSRNPMRSPDGTPLSAPPMSMSGPPPRPPFPPPPPPPANLAIPPPPLPTPPAPPRPPAWPPKPSLPYLRTDSVSSSISSTPGTPSTPAAFPTTPKYAYTSEPRPAPSWNRTPSYPGTGARSEKTFGSRHDKSDEKPSLFGSSGGSSSVTSTFPPSAYDYRGRTATASAAAAQPRKELRNKELDELFKQQSQEAEAAKRRQEQHQLAKIPKIRKKPQPPPEPATPSKEKERESERDKDQDREKGKDKERDKTDKERDKTDKERDKTDKERDKTDKSEEQRRREKEERKKARREERERREKEAAKASTEHKPHKTKEKDRDKERDKEKEKEREKEKDRDKERDKEKEREKEKKEKKKERKEKERSESEKKERKEEKVSRKQAEENMRELIRAQQRLEASARREARKAAKSKNAKLSGKIFSRKGGSGSDSDGDDKDSSDSGSDSESDEEKRTKRSFELELKQILASEEMVGGLSMYDRLKRRRESQPSAPPDEHYKKDSLSALKEKRAQQKKNKRKVLLDDDDEDDDGSDNEQRQSEDEEEDAPEADADARSEASELEAPASAHDSDSKSPKKAKKEASISPKKKKKPYEMSEIFGQESSHSSEEENVKKDEEPEKMKKKKKKKRTVVGGTESEESAAEAGTAESSEERARKLKHLLRQKEKARKEKARRQEEDTVRKSCGLDKAARATDSDSSAKSARKTASESTKTASNQPTQPSPAQLSPRPAKEDSLKEREKEKKERAKKRKAEEQKDATVSLKAKKPKKEKKDKRHREEEEEQTTPKKSKVSSPRTGETETEEETAAASITANADPSEPETEEKAAETKTEKSKVPEREEPTEAELSPKLEPKTPPSTQDILMDMLPDTSMLEKRLKETESKDNEPPGTPHKSPKASPAKLVSPKLHSPKVSSPQLSSPKPKSTSLSSPNVAETETHPPSTLPQHLTESQVPPPKVESTPKGHGSQSHVDEVIDEVVSGYVEIDPEELMKVPGRKQAKKSPSFPVAQELPKPEVGLVEPTPHPPCQIAAAATNSQPTQLPTAAALPMATIAPAPHTPNLHSAPVPTSVLPPTSQPIPAPTQTQSQTPFHNAPPAHRPVLSVPPSTVSAPPQPTMAKAKPPSQPATPAPPQPHPRASAPPDAPTTASSSAAAFISQIQQQQQVLAAAAYHPALQAAYGSGNAYSGLAALATDPSARVHAQAAALLEMQKSQQQQAYAAAGLLNPRLGPAALDPLVLQRLQAQQLEAEEKKRQAAALTHQQQQQLLQKQQQQPQQSPQPPPQQQPTPAPVPQAAAPPGREPPSTATTGTNILLRYPARWQGSLALKNDAVSVQMHWISGNRDLVGSALPGPPGTLKIAQRMRLEPAQLEGVQRRMAMPSEHCVLLALPCGTSPANILESSQTLQTGFIQYLQAKQAAGIVNVPLSGSTSAATTFVVHIFPPCEFSDTHLVHIAPEFIRSIQQRQTSFLYIVITTVL